MYLFFLIFFIQSLIWNYLHLPPKKYQAKAWRVWEQQDFVVNKESSNEFGREPDLSTMSCDADFHLPACLKNTTNKSHAEDSSALWGFRPCYQSFKTAPRILERREINCLKMKLYYLLGRLAPCPDNFLQVFAFSHV